MTASPPHSGTATPRTADLDGVRFGLTHVVLALAVLCVTALAMPDPVDLVFVALMAVCGGFELSWGFAALFGFSCWACYTGFVENGLAQLTLYAPDLQRLAALVSLAVAGSLLHRVVRHG